MSSAPDDSISVETCLARIITAYRDASIVFGRLQSQCAEDRAPAPPRVLEESIDLAPGEIEKEKKRGESRLGKTFATGDDTAIIELQQIVIHIQTALLDKLRKALDRSEDVDLTTLIDEADLGRDRCISALLALKRRLLESTSGEDGTTQEDGKSTTSGRSHSSDTTSGAENIQANGGRRTNLRGIFRSNTSRAVSESQSSNRSNLHRSHNSMLTLLPKGPQYNTYLSTNSIASTTRPLPEEGGDDSTARGSSSSGSNQETASTLSTEPFPDYNGPPSPTASSSPKLTRTGSAFPSRPSAAGSLVSVGLPTPSNDYLGFCKGAARLQTGDRGAMEKRKEFNDSWLQSTVYYLACCNSRCVFATHMNLEAVWSRVWSIKEKGIKFRWTFLAKSHVPQSKVKNHQYQYKCLLCVFLGMPAPIIEGTDVYINHVSQRHRGRVLGDVVLYRTWCITDRIAEDNEDFDINLFPLTVPEYALLQKQNEVLSDEVIVGPMTDETSSAPVPEPDNEPWCDDLPDFHRADNFERGFREGSIRSFRSYG